MALTEVDRNLLQRCLDEESGAWKDFVDRFIGLFVHVINHSAHSRGIRLTTDDIDDLGAEVFLALLGNNFAVLRQFRGNCSLATYLTVVARRVVVREMAKLKSAEFGAVRSSDAKEIAAEKDENKRIEDNDEVQRMLQDLPKKDAEIVREFHLEGRSYREISENLGIPVNSIGPTLNRARDRLKQRQVQSKSP